MTVTVAIEKLGTTAVADVDLVCLPQSSLVLVASDKTPSVTYSEYVFASGSMFYGLTVNIRRAFDPKALNGYGRTNFLFSLSGVRTVTDSVLGILDEHPVDAGIYVNWPGRVVEDVAEFRQILNNVFCLTFDTVTAGVISDQLITDLAYGTTNLY